MTKKNQTAKRALCAVLALAMLIGGTFAYFSDYASTQVKGTAGTVAVAMDSDINLLDAEGRDILNPGDMRDGSFSVTNEGNKSIDVRTTIAVTAVDHAGNAIDFTGSATEQSEYDLYAAEDVELVEGEGYAPKAGAQPLQVKSINGNTITYVLPEYSLNGNSDKYDEVETIDGVDTFTQDNEFVFLFKGASENKWQASGVSIDVLVEAKQHENTGAGWDIVAQENVSIGAINQSAVKGENVITDGANASSAIPVISKNENGEDLNASASLITGAKADELLDALEEAGLAQKEDVDILIDVESDDFEGMADTTFDVSDLAEDGDTAVIMHYDEAKGEWEYIATETVVDGKVSGDFSSYSPVAIQIIKKEEGEDTPELNPEGHKLMEMSFAGTFNYKKLVFTNEAAPAGVETTDVSEAQDGSIVQYVEGATLYITTVDGGKIIAPDDISWMFGNSGFEEIHFHNFDVSNVTTANEVFPYVSATVYMDEAAWYAMPGMNNTTLATDPYGDTSILVNCQPLDACQGHETAECQHESGMYNPMTSTTHEFYCYGCTASFEQDCTFSAETGTCEHCSNTSTISLMPMSEEWSSLWTTYKLSSKPLLAPGTVTVADMEAEFAAKGYDLAADGKAIAGITTVRNGELAQSVSVSAGDTVYIVLTDAAQEILAADVTHYGLSDVLTTYEMAGYYPGVIYYVDDMSVIPEECLANGNELVGSYSEDANVMFYWTGEHESDAYVYSETGWRIPGYLLSDYEYYNSLIPLNLDAVEVY